MTVESTVSAPAEYAPRPWEGTTLGEQLPALAVMERIAAAHPNLPGAFITASYVTPGEVEAQMQSFASLEAWREALNVDPADVVPGNCAPERHHLQFCTTVAGIPVRVYVMGDLVEQVSA